LLLAISSASALSCDITEPMSGYKYSSAINIPLNFTQDGADLCQITLNNGIENTTTTCNDESQFDVDYDDNYTLQVYVHNFTNVESCNQSFEVDRTSDFEASKPQFSFLVAVFFVVVGLLMSAFGHVFQKEHEMIRVFLYGLTAITIYLGNGYMINAAREYIKNPSMLELMETFFMMFNWAVIFIAFIIFTYLTINLVNKIRSTPR
jgi:hypothetical protein